MRHHLLYKIVFVLLLIPVVAAGKEHSKVRSFVVQHIVESKNPPQNAFSFDSLFVFLYSRGLPGIEGTASSANVNLYIFGEDGTPAQGQTGVICNPCTFHLDASARKVRKTVEQMAEENAGGLRDLFLLGYATISITGDAEATSPLFFIQNTQTNAFDTSVMAYTPEEISAAP